METVQVKKKFIPCFGVREKNQFQKIVERFRCRAPWRQRKLVTEFRTRNCAERTLSTAIWFPREQNWTELHCKIPRVSEFYNSANGNREDPVRRTCKEHTMQYIRSLIDGSLDSRRSRGQLLTKLPTDELHYGAHAQKCLDYSRCCTAPSELVTRAVQHLL